MRNVPGIIRYPAFIRGIISRWHSLTSEMIADTIDKNRKEVFL